MEPARGRAWLTDPEFLQQESGDLVDSIATPWPESATEDFPMRQATAQQLTDSSCALLTPYQHEFAVPPGERWCDSLSVPRAPLI